MIEKLLMVLLGFGFETVLFFLGLWVMVRVQKLDYTFPGLLLSAVVTAGLDLIPVAGHYLAGVGLLLCVLRLTKAKLFPAVALTSVVAYALVFCMNYYVLSPRAGIVRQFVRARVGNGDPATPKEAMANISSSSMKCFATVAGWFHKGPAPTPANPGLVATPAAQVAGAPSTPDAPTVPAAPVKTFDPAAVKRAGEVANNFAIKGVSKGQSDSMAIVFSGVKNYTIGLGESLSMETIKGNKITVRCQSVDERKVVLDVDGIEVALLHR